jgi:hypothetical protein
MNLFHFYVFTPFFYVFTQIAYVFTPHFYVFSRVSNVLEVNLNIQKVEELSISFSYLIVHLII